jgi:hypothetical protein
MVIDYKSVSFSFDQIKRKKRLRLLRLIGAVLVIILLYLLIAKARDRGKIEEVQSLLLENKPSDASLHLNEIVPSLFHKSSKKELNALVYLYTGDYAKAKALLETIAGKSTVIDSRKFLDYFAERAEYRKLGIYTDYLDKRPGQPEEKENLRFYQIQAKTGQLDYRQSQELIGQLSTAFKKEQGKALALTDKINRQIQAGKINYIFDIDGKPLAYYDTREKKTVPLAPGIHFAAFTPADNEGIQFYRLTLESGIQELIHRLFRNLNGTFLLMKVDDSGIAAAYSKPVDPDKSGIDTVFSETYEPGSIIKTLTLFAYLTAQQTPQTSQQTGPTAPSPPAELFPLQCEGLWQISENSGTGSSRNRLFRDWTVHHRVADGEEALAVSCNIAFAKMGVQTGFQSLSSVLDKFYFNAAANGLTLTDLFLTFTTGSYNKGISTNYQLANLAVGLNEVTITTFHAALLAAIISQNGSLYAPHLITNQKNLLNIAFYNHLPRLLDVFNGSTVFLKLKSAMRLAVEHPNGTGKRAKVDVVTVALKTGTAGNRKLGLDAILMGYFPAEKPEYAFAFRLERAGKAEWRGALFLNEFLTAFYQLKRPLQRGVK